MPDIDILNQMIKDSAKVQLSNHYDRMKAELTEPNHPSSSTVIYNIPDNAVIIRADAFSSDSVFKGSNGECKRADYIIVSNAAGKKVVVYIEMKTTRGSRSQIIQQLKGAQCFLTYCREIGKTFWNEPDFLKTYAQRFVSIGHTSIPKRKTSISRSAGKHDRPDNMLKIDWPHHLQFNLIAGA